MLKRLLIAATVAVFTSAPVSAFAADGAIFPVPEGKPMICIFSPDGPIGCIPIKLHGHRHHKHHHTEGE